MEPGRPEAEAIAVLDGRVLSTGTLESMQPWLSQHDVRIDETLKDKVILPGFIEPHSHCWMSAGLLALNFIGPLQWPGPNGMNPPLGSFNDIIKHLNKLHQEEEDLTRPIIAWGYDRAKQGGAPDRDTLDKISRERPIFLISWAPHFVYLNSPALALAKVPEDHKHVHIHRYPDGRLNGVLSEVAGVQMGLAPVIAEISRNSGVKGLNFMANIAKRAGVTTIADLIFGCIDYEKELQDHKEATRDESFPVRMRLTPHGATLIRAHGDNAARFARDLSQHDTDKLYFRGVKFLNDGSFPLMGARVNFPGYLDGSNGLPGDHDLINIMMPYWEEGLQLHCHANGDEAVDGTLDALAQLQATLPRFDHRFTVEHYAISNPMQARRLKALGGIASVNNYFSHFRSLLHRNHAYGPDRSDCVARLGSLEREGVTFALHSDYPQVVVPMHPLTAVYAAVNRIAEDGETVIAPGERIGLDRALRAVTIDAAYILGLEDKIGSLEQGKFADFCVLEEDPYEVDPKQLKEIPVWGTALSGKLFEA